jgi:zinc/manganese transport system substrate-binding protein
MKMRTILTGRWLAARAAAGAAALLGATALAGCGAGGSASTGTVQVLAGESFWGSIAAQLGGARVQVQSLVSNPDADPHDYEATAGDARAVAQAQYVIVNGAGYDSWLSKLVTANPDSGRTVLDVAALAGRRDGDNPHMWYSPTIVRQVVQRISADLRRLDPAGAGYYAQRETAFTTTALRHYDDLRSAIRTRFHGVRVGATESIFVDLAADLQLDLVTPPGYMRAVAEGEDPTPADRATVDAQVARHEIQVLVYNSQNSTPDVQGLVGRAGALHIAVVAVTETMTPRGATFQEWQSRQLTELEQALAAASG